MSESRGGGPANVTRPQVPTAPRAAPPPVPVGKPMSPRAPAVGPVNAPPARAPAVTVSLGVHTLGHDSEPPSGGWDAADADTVTTFPEPTELPAPTPRNIPPVKPAPAPATQASPATAAPATPHSPGTMRGPYPTSPGVGGPAVEAAAAPATRGAAAARAGAASAASAASSTSATAGLGSAMREEVWAIVRAAVEEAMGPLVARQRELEARVERAERFADAAKGGTRPVGAGIPTSSTTAQPAGPAATSTAASRLAALGPAISSIPVQMSASVAPAPFTAPAPAVPRIEMTSSADKPAHPVGPRPSLPPTGTYGVTVMPSMRPSLDLSTVGAVDVSGFDGGRRKRMVASSVVVLMLLIIAGVVTMTLLSHS